MTVHAVTTVKDELDVLPYTLEHMLGQVDHVTVADNRSTDGTREWLDDLQRSGKYHERLWVQDEPEIGYYQAQRQTRMAAAAAEQGASWVVSWDADELWYSPFGRIADVLSNQPATVSQAALYDRVPTALDGAEANPLLRMGWRRREPAPLPKVACRPTIAVRIEQGNHAAHFDTETETGLLVVFHYPYRSSEQMIRKARNGAAAYAATDLPEDVGKHWRDYGRLTDEQIGDVFREHFWSAAPERDDTLIFDPAPV